MSIDANSRPADLFDPYSYLWYKTETLESLRNVKWARRAPRLYSGGGDGGCVSDIGPDDGKTANSTI